MYALYI